MNLKPLANRIANLFSRGVVRRTDDAAEMQSLQVDLLADETRDGLERPQSYGFTSVPHVGAEAVVAFVGGYRDHGVVLVVDDRRYRLKGLEAGEVALYTDEGDHVLLKRGGVIEVKASAKVVLDAPVVELAGSAGLVPRGQELNAAVAALGAAVAAAFTGMAASAAGGPLLSVHATAAAAAVTAAVTAFNTAAASALSQRVKLG